MKIRKVPAHHNDNYVILGNIVIQKKKKKKIGECMSQIFILLKTNCFIICTNPTMMIETETDVILLCVFRFSICYCSDTDDWMNVILMKGNLLTDLLMIGHVRIEFSYNDITISIPHSDRVVYRFTAITLSHQFPL